MFRVPASHGGVTRIVNIAAGAVSSSDDRAVLLSVSGVRLPSIEPSTVCNASGLRQPIARNFERRRDQPFEQGQASKIRTQIPFREPPGFLRFPNNLGDDAHVEA